jgi:hypothetical protein
MKFKSNIRKRFIVAEADGLVLETIQTYSKDCSRRGLPQTQTKGAVPKQALRLLKLKGTWRANSQNELFFQASGRKVSPDKFTFKGAWKINIGRYPHPTVLFMS